MATSVSNFPNGVGSFGVPVFPDQAPGGFAKVKFVGAPTAGYLSAAAGDSYENPAPTLLSMLRDGVVDSADRGTLIVVRKGHTETISAADHFSLLGSRKRIKIVGEGEGAERPTFTWSTAVASWLFDTQSIVMENMILQQEPTTGTITVAAPITVSAAGCVIRGCRINCGTDANNKVTIPVTVGPTGGTQFKFIGNVARGATAAAMTTFLQLVAADDCEVAFNDISVATSGVAVGAIRLLTTASLNIDVHHNKITNTLASSTGCFTGMAAATGWVRYNDLRSMTTGLTQLNTMGALAANENYGVGVDGARGAILLTVST